MQENYYLSEGDILGGHYEIVKVLGEDEFEIVYLVKDTHRLESLFVIKEFFLKAYAKRENLDVKVIAKSKLLFEETKEDMIKEIIIAQKNNEKNQVQTYGYLEENNTIYTIMEFLNDSNMQHYLGVDKSQKEEVVFAAVKPIKEEKPVVEKEKKTKSYLFLKILIVSALLLMAMFYYSWDMIKTDKEKAKEKRVSNVTVVEDKTVYTPALTSRDEEEKESVKQEVKVDEVKVDENKSRTFNASYIEEGEENNTDANLTDIPTAELEDLSDLPIAKTYPEEEVSLGSTIKVQEEPKRETSSSSLGTRIGGDF